MSRAHHTDVRYPHVAGCLDCRDLWLCNVCSRPAKPSERCANGRCHNCHSHVCSPGITGQAAMRPHGAGTVGGAELHARMRQNGGKIPKHMLISDERAANAVCQRLVFMGATFICERRDDGWHFTVTEVET